MAARGHLVGHLAQRAANQGKLILTGCLHVGGASFIYVGTGLRTYIWPTIDHVSVLAIYIIFRGNYCIRCTKNGWGTRHYLQWPAMVSVDVAVVLPASLATAGAATHLINSSPAEANTAALGLAPARAASQRCLGLVSPIPSPLMPGRRPTSLRCPETNNGCRLSIQQGVHEK